jgi:hypothetical protein
MSPIAMEAALAELGAWRREAERKIARLEGELVQLRALGASAPIPAAVPTVPRELARDQSRDPTAPILPEFQPLRDIPPAWATPAATATAADSPPAATPAPAAAPASITPRVQPRPQYDLTMKPGESIDLPSGLDGGRRQKTMGWLVVLAIIIVMGGLVISALASQR